LPPPLGAADVVDRAAGELADVEGIEADLGVGQAPADRRRDARRADRAAPGNDLSPSTRAASALHAALRAPLRTPAEHPPKSQH
jgi:hypothetical protein